MSDNPVSPDACAERPRRAGASRRGILAGIAGATVLPVFSPYVARAATEITFASARFGGMTSFAFLVDAYNKSQNNVRISYVELPPSSASTEVHQSLVQQLARRNGTPDVFTQDIIWIAEFASAGWAMPLDEYFDASARKVFFPGLVDACTYQGKLMALPWFITAGMLYYRKDLLDAAKIAPPKTWNALAEISKNLVGQDNTAFGFSWQAKQAEVLVCNLVEYIHSNNGTILSPDGKQCLINQPAAIEAVQFMYDTINKLKITPQDALSWNEEPSRRPFTAGQSIFLRNWPYAWAVSQDEKESKVVGKVGVVPLPAFKGGHSAATLGGYQVGVNAFTKNREAALDFARWVTSPEAQILMGLNIGQAPARSDVYDDARIVEARPYWPGLRATFNNAVPRPVTPRYPQLTLVLQSEVSKALTNGDIAGSLESAKTKIDAILAK
jgi:multiple sugar transport system substrate-binding protein